MGRDGSDWQWETWHRGMLRGLIFVARGCFWGNRLGGIDNVVTTSRLLLLHHKQLERILDFCVCLRPAFGVWWFLSLALLQSAQWCPARVLSLPYLTAPLPPCRPLSSFLPLQLSFAFPCSNCPFSVHFPSPGWRAPLHTRRHTVKLFHSIVLT